MREVLKFYIPFALIVIAGFGLALWYADPAPPDSIRMATGPAGGAYAAFGERYRKALAAHGVEVELVETVGTLENIALLNDPNQGVDVAFVQGASIDDPSDYPDLESLGSLYREPIWIFARAARRPTRITDLAGMRIAVGVQGSGTRAVSDEMLAVNGLDADSVQMVEMSGDEAGAALLAGELDAMFLVTGGRLDMMRRLTTAPGIELMSLERAEAYTRLYAGVSAVTLPQGALDLAADQPPEDITFLAAIASLVAREDLHPAVVQLLIQTAEELHRPAGLFANTGEFPSPDYVDFPLNAQAWRYYERGPSFLRSYLPYWAANLVTRLWILLVPAFALLFPFMRIAPPIFVWQIRRRIYKWYKNLRRIEVAARNERDAERRGTLLRQLAALQADVARVRVPLAFAVELYHLKQHMQFVERQIIGADVGKAAIEAEQRRPLREASSI